MYGLKCGGYINKEGMKREAIWDGLKSSFFEVFLEFCKNKLSLV